jgi:predicted nucleic acid-binding protein
MASSSLFSFMTANVKAEADRLGRVLQSSDAWIAATAVKLDVPLVSHDQFQLR